LFLPYYSPTRGAAVQYPVSDTLVFVLLLADGMCGIMKFSIQYVMS
jgi:hypothetical protein